MLADVQTAATTSLLHLGNKEIRKKERKQQALQAYNDPLTGPKGKFSDCENVMPAQPVREKNKRSDLTVKHVNKNFEDWASKGIGNHCDATAAVHKAAAKDARRFFFLLPPECRLKKNKLQSYAKCSSLR